MKPIQFILLLTPLFGVFFVKSRKIYLTKALTRVGFLLASLVFSIMIFSPNLLLYIAHKLGVGRGTDLLVYTLSMCFFISIVLVFTKVKEIESKLTKITREIALINSNAAKK